MSVHSFIHSLNERLLHSGSNLTKKIEWGTKHKVAIFSQDYIPEERHDNKQNKIHVITHFITKKIISILEKIYTLKRESPRPNKDSSIREQAMWISEQVRKNWKMAHTNPYPYLVL